ncbi:MAG TPA: hypothetical protein VHT70_04815 [Candidatus Saccharimonadales bacterium]|jgi:hypothetical protein|nr:hypothetical protein [Candidatus Saccharimonadales bacterium]
MRYQYKNTKNKQNSSPRRIFRLRTFLLLAIVIIVLGAAAILYAWHRHSKINTTLSPTANSATKGEPAASASASPNTTSSTSTNQPGDDKSSTGSSTPTATLVDITGNFVSNHHPNLSGKPAPNIIQSTCTTTEGATCQIIFTMGSVTKMLPAQVTDRGGSTYWTWKLQDIGLTAGSWHIQAKATLGTQVKTADDALTLEVQQ